MDSATLDETVLESPSPQAYSPITSRNHKVFNATSCKKQHSKGLLTPCRQVGLRRKSPRNVISPPNSDGISLVTPRNLRFVSPAGNCSFMGSVLDKHIPHEEETCKSLGKRLTLENMNGRSKQCKYEVEGKPLQDKHEERTTEKIQTENFNNKGLQNDMDVHSCKDSDHQSKLYGAYNMIMSQNSDEKEVIKKLEMENFDDETQQYSVDKLQCKDLDLQSNLDNKHHIISSDGRNGEAAIQKTLMENKNDVTHHFNVDAHAYKYLDFQSNSSNKDNVNSFDRMIDCTEDNLNILKQQITVKEEEVKRLKLTLLYKKKVMHVD
jgi:hypothetical protein